MLRRCKSPGKRLKTALNEVLGESVNFQRNSYICGANSFTLFLGFVYPTASRRSNSPEALSVGGSPWEILSELHELNTIKKSPGGSPYLTPKNSLQPPRRHISPRDTGSPGRVLFEGWRLPSRSPDLPSYLRKGKI